MSSADDDLLALAQEPTRLDLTPMVDCVFLILVFFMCIRFRVLEAKLPVPPPQSTTLADPVAMPAEHLWLQIHCDEYGIREDRVPGRSHRDLDPATGRPNPFTLVGHRVHYQLGPLRLATAAALQQELQRLADAPVGQAPDPRSGQWRRLPVVIEPLALVVNQDVVAVVDLVRAAGFADVSLAAPADGR